MDPKVAEFRHGNGDVMYGSLDEVGKTHIAPCDDVEARLDLSSTTVQPLFLMDPVIHPCIEEFNARRTHVRWGLHTAIS